MTDAVERLRDVEANLGRAWRLEVADEITRLRSDLARARTALEQIADIGDKITDPRNDYGIRMCNIAHAGLTVLAH